MTLDKIALISTLNDGALPPLQQTLAPEDLVGRLQAAAVLKDVLHVVFDCVSGLFTEKETGNAVAASLTARLQAALSAVGAEGQRIPGAVGQGLPETSVDQLFVRSGAPILRSPAPDEAGGHNAIPNGASSGVRRQPTALPGSTVVDPADANLPPASTFIAPQRLGPPPESKAYLTGSDLIKVLGRDVVPIYTEGAELLGSMPTFGENITEVRTELGQTMSTGWIALRVVVVPYNRGIDPHNIAGFVPVHGLERGPITTGPAGTRLIIPDVARPV